MNFIKKRQSGFFLIEVVVASAIVGGVLISLLSLTQNTVEVSQRALERTQAGYLMEEGGEAIKTIRDRSWSNISSLTNGNTYYLSWDGSSWNISTTPNMIDSTFTRTVVFSSVSRDASDDIVAIGGTVDPRIKKVLIDVSWNSQSGPRAESVVFYLVDIRT